MLNNKTVTIRELKESVDKLRNSDSNTRMIIRNHKKLLRVLKDNKNNTSKTLQKHRERIDNLLNRQRSLQNKIVGQNNRLLKLIDANNQRVDGLQSRLKQIIALKFTFLSRRFTQLNPLPCLLDSSDSPPARFTDSDGIILDRYRMDISQMNGTVVRISTPYPLTNDELSFLLTELTLENENDNKYINLTYSFNNTYTDNKGVLCANGCTGGFSYSTVYITIWFQSPDCTTLPSTYIDFIPPNDMVFLESQQVIYTTDSNCSNDPVSYSLPNITSVSTSITTFITDVKKNSTLKLITLNSPGTDLDIYRLDELSSAFAAGSGYVSGECLNTYLIVPFCNWLGFFPNVSYNFNELENTFTLIKIDKNVLKSQDPYDSQTGNSPYISVTIDWGDNTGDMNSFSGSNINAVPEGNILFANMIASDDDDFVYFVTTNNTDVYQDAYEASYGTTPNGYILPPLINFKESENSDIKCAFLLSTTQVSNLGLLFRLRSPQGDLLNLVNSLNCASSPLTNYRQNDTKVANGGVLSDYISAKIFV